MALEKFNNATKHQVVNEWYPDESKTYIRFKLFEIQQDLDTNTRSKILRKDEIKAIIKHFGKPMHISDQTYLDYVSRLKLLNEWD